MTKGANLDVTKYHFLGVVSYAQHNFARLRPLLYSETGRTWDGPTQRGWFPHEDLVYNVDRELHYATNTFWTFRLKPNPKFEPGKDVFIAVHTRPAVEVLAAMEPLDAETLRIAVTETGLAEGPNNKAGVCAPEVGGRWVLTPELSRQADGRWRPTSGQDLKHLRMLEGDPTALCGLSTQDQRFFLPPIVPAIGDIRDWTPPEPFLEELSVNLRRWAPYGVHRARFQAAAQALRELLPHLGAVSGNGAAEAKAATARAVDLVLDGLTLTSATEDILALIVEQEPFKREIEERRARLDADWEAEALRAVAEVEGAARDKLLADQRRIEGEIAAESARLAVLRGEIAAQEAAGQEELERRAADMAALEREVDALLARAAAEPAKLLAEWIGASGFVVSGAAATEPAPAARSPIETSPPPAELEAGSTQPVSNIEPGALGAALFKASPATGKGEPWLLMIDAALRARELPVLMGPMAREFAEAWLAVAGGPSPPVLLSDPTLLSLADLMPGGARGQNAPLVSAFDRARREPERAVVALLDDLDPAAAGFWLPELARCQRQPERYGFPSNLLFLAIVEADPSGMGLSLARAGELFPLAIDVGDERAPTGVLPETPLGLSLSMIAPGKRSAGWRDRVASFEQSLAATYPADRIAELSAQLDEFLRYAKGGGDQPQPSDALGSRLTRGAIHIVRSGA